MKVKEISCGEFKDQIDKCFNGKLDFIQSKRFEQHAQTCERCRSLFIQTLHKKIDREGFWTKFIQTQTQDCFSEEIIKECWEQELILEERKLVLEHLRNCDRCFSLIAVYVESTEKAAKK